MSTAPPLSSASIVAVRSPFARWSDVMCPETSSSRMPSASPSACAVTATARQACGTSFGFPVVPDVSDTNITSASTCAARPSVDVGRASERSTAPARFVAERVASMIVTPIWSAASAAG
jgi:hypothetical protein